MTRLLQFWGDGLYFLGEWELPATQGKQVAARVRDPRNTHVDVLDEGVLIARFVDMDRIKNKRKEGRYGS